jgi:predicted transcriptional regulator
MLREADGVRASYHIELDAEIENRLLRLAEAQGRSADAFVREAVERYVEREERRERLRQDALGAWTEYQAAGLHVTGDEADAWLSRLEAGEDIEPPASHT